MPIARKLFRAPASRVFVNAGPRSPSGPPAAQSNPFLAYRRGLPPPAQPPTRHRDAKLKTLCIIPILGYLDDLLIVPLGILLVVRLIPADVLKEHRMSAEKRQATRPVSYAAAVFMVGMWIVAAAALYWWLEPLLLDWL
jgi:hypothetical protein